MSSSVVREAERTTAELRWWRKTCSAAGGGGEEDPAGVRGMCRDPWARGHGRAKRKREGEEEGGVGAEGPRTNITRGRWC